MWYRQSKWLHTGGRGWNPRRAQTAVILLQLRLKESERGENKTVIPHRCMKTTISAHQRQTAPPDQAVGRSLRDRTVKTHCLNLSQQWHKMALALSGTGRGASAAALVALFIWFTSSGLSSHNSLTSTWITTTAQNKNNPSQMRTVCPLLILKK